MIFISSALNSFKDCINFLKSNDLYFETVTDLSSTEEGNSCIKNDKIRMISLDNVKNYFTSKKIPKSREHCPICKKTGKCRAKFDHNSVDALYINFSDDMSHIYLFEFKNIDIYDKYEISGNELREIDDFLDRVKSSIPTEEFNKLNKIFNKAKNAYLDKHSGILKLKAYESIYSIIPHMYDEYCLEMNIDCDIHHFKKFLLDNKIHFILVYNFEKPKNDNELRTRTEKIKKLNCKEDIKNIQRIRDFTFDTVDIIQGKDSFNKFYSRISK